MTFPNRTKEHVSSSQEFLGSIHIQNGPRVRPTRHREGNPRRHIGLNQARNDIHRWALGGQNHVDTCCPSLLSQTDNGIFHLFAGNHHKVSQLIHDDHNQGQWNLFFSRLLVKFLHLGIVAFQVPNTHLTKELIAFLHLIHDLLQGTRSLAGVGHNRNEKVGNVIVYRQLHHLRVNHHELNLIRSSLHQDRGDDAIDRDGFP